MAADIMGNLARAIDEELHLYALVRDDAEAVRIHVQEAERHLAEADAEIRRIIESLETLTGLHGGSAFSPYAVKAVLGGALHIVSELQGEAGDLQGLPAYTLELAELADLVNKQARRLNDREPLETVDA